MQTTQTPPAAPLDGRRIVAQLRKSGLLDAAARESDELVLRAAERIQHIVGDTRRELLSLKTQVDAALGLIDAPSLQRHEPGADTISVSTDARRALEEASNELERLLSDLTSAKEVKAPALRVRTRPAAAAAVIVLATAAGLGIATGWLAASPSTTTTNVAPVPVATTGRHTTEVPVPSQPAVPSRSTAATTPEAPVLRNDDAPAASAPRVLPDPAAEVAADAPQAGNAAELRRSAEAWLQAYYERGETSAGSPAVPVVRDERPAGRRLLAGVRRVIAPARIGVFGDAAYLSTSVTEYSPSGDLVTLVAQLWTRKAGQWHLDDVRIVSAASAAEAFAR